MVRVAVAQFAPGMDKRENLATIERLAGEAADRGARVLACPEYAMFTAPAMDQRFVDTAEPLDGPFVSGLRDAARRHGVYLVAGTNEAPADGDRFHNTLVAADPEGMIAAHYRKLHLYDAFGVTESSWIRAGNIEAPRTFTVEGTTFGMQTCYDLRFPEVTRQIVDAGADVLLLPAEWVPGPLKEDHWRTLLRARAIENTMYVAASGQNAPTGSGWSAIIDPMGVPVAALGEQTGITMSDVSPGRVAEVRERNPALRLRRFRIATNDA